MFDFTCVGRCPPAGAAYIAAAVTVGGADVATGDARDDDGVGDTVGGGGIASTTLTR